MPVNEPQTLGRLNDPRVRLRTIGIRKLRLDFHPRQGLNDDVLATHVNNITAGSRIDPVRVFFDGNEYYLATGFYRVAAAKSLGRKMVLADVRWGTREDAEAELRGIDEVSDL